MPQHSTTIPQEFGVAAPGYAAARRGAAILDRSHRGRLVLRGADRRSYLHGLVTNDVAALATGEGCYAALLTPQGRMITDLFLYELGDRLLVSLPASTAAAVAAQLDRMVFAEDVQVSNVTEALACVGIVGPTAVDALARVMPEAAGRAAALADHASADGRFQSEDVTIVRTADAGVAGFDLYCAAPTAEALATALRAAGAVDLDPVSAEALRIEGGVPAFGIDMDADTIPLEAGIEARAISFTKGCYVGQEVIVRVLHRGHGRVARKLVGLTMTGTVVPSTGAVISAGGRGEGRVTSAVMSPALNAPIALGYVPRDVSEPGTHVQVASVDASVTALPFIG